MRSALALLVCTARPAAASWEAWPPAPPNAVLARPPAPLAAPPATVIDESAPYAWVVGDDPARRGCLARWCDPAWPTQHCHNEVCAGCAFCTARVGCRAQWCSPEFEGHCQQESCKPCAFCGAVVMRAANGSKACASWCERANKDSHCGDERCLGCTFCDAAPAGGGLVCEGWCDANSASSHCADPQGRCLGCGFACEPTSKPSVARGTPSGAQTVVAADSQVAKDGAVACASWCSVDSSAAHCADGRCSGCGFCFGVTAACAHWCSAEHAAQHCAPKAGGCEGCAFCMPPSQPTSPSPPPRVLLSPAPPPSRSPPPTAAPATAARPSTETRPANGPANGPNGPVVGGVGGGMGDGGISDGVAADYHTDIDEGGGPTEEPWPPAPPTLAWSGHLDDAWEVRSLKC